ncbi:hypothetical protein [Brevundimonas sp. Leaf363]|uniref:hypothetical protein n=1 Tax=Brevundimonas sp. Leaf363 TaxID=1736353 RepID=UPI0012E2E43A|nr:hypothetical protein [Brevundimonas sp. Leaf363]
MIGLHITHFASFEFELIRAAWKRELPNGDGFPPELADDTFGAHWKRWSDLNSSRWQSEVLAWDLLNAHVNYAQSLRNSLAHWVMEAEDRGPGSFYIRVRSWTLKGWLKKHQKWAQRYADLPILHRAPGPPDGRSEYYESHQLEAYLERLHDVHSIVAGMNDTEGPYEPDGVVAGRLGRRPLF